MGRLFWRIFIPFWLSAVMIIVLSLLWVDTQVKKEIYPLIREQQLRPKSFLIVNLFEAGIRDKKVLAELSGEGRDSIKLYITNSKNIIYGENLKASEKLTALEFDVTSLSQTSYRVRAYIPDTSPMSLRTARQLLISYIVAVMVAFAFISLLLTWYFVRPIKLLRKHTQEIANGNLDIDTSDLMLNRRDELGDLARSFDDMSINISEQINTKQQLVHDLTHEIHAPLARLDMAAELALITQNNNEREELIDRVHNEVIKIKTLTKDIVRMSDHIGSQNIDNASFKPKDVIASSIVDALFTHKNRNIQFDNQSELRINGGKNYFTSAVENIIRNALNHTTGDIDISTKDEKRHIYVSVRDYGNGVSEKQLKKITLPFYKGKESKGSGIGLAIVSKAINALGGEIKIRNVSPGLEVTLVLPVDHRSISESNLDNVSK